MILTFIKNLIADRISKSWEEQTYEENKTLAIIGKLLNPENLKRLGKRDVHVPLLLCIMPPSYALQGKAASF